MVKIFRVLAPSLLFSVFMLLACQSTIAQKIDSLRQKLAVEQTDTGQVSLMNDLARHYFPDKPDSIVYFAEKANDLALSIKFNAGISRSYRAMGYSHMARYDYEQAMKFFYKALKVAKEHSLKMEEARIHIVIGIIEKEQENYKKALEQSKKALKILQETKSTSDLASLYDTMGECFYELHDYYQALEHFEMAYEQMKKQNKLPDIEAVVFNLGRTYYKMNELDKAKIYLKDVIDRAKTATVSQITLGKVHNLLGAIHTEQNNLPKAENHFNKAMIISLKHQDIKIQSEVYAHLAELAYKRHDIRALYQAHQSYITLSDSLHKNSNSEKVAELSVKYQTQIKENEIEKLEQAKRAQRYTILAIFVIALLVAALLFLLIKQLRAQNEIAEKKIENYRIEQEKLKKEIEKKFSEKEVVKSQLEAAKHEHDKLIFHLKTASEEKQEILKELEKNNARIMELEKSLDSKSEEYESEQLFFSLKNQLDTLIQEKGKTAKAELKRVREMIGNLIVEQKNKDFFRKLKESYPKLSNEDLRLSAFMRNHFSNSEIAEFLEITQETLYTRKHRLKRKLDLDKDKDISEFLIEFDDKS